MCKKLAHQASFNGIFGSLFSHLFVRSVRMVRPSIHPSAPPSFSLISSFARLSCHSSSFSFRSETVEGNEQAKGLENRLRRCPIDGSGSLHQRIDTHVRFLKRGRRFRARSHVRFPRLSLSSMRDCSQSIRSFAFSLFRLTVGTSFRSPILSFVCLSFYLFIIYLLHYFLFFFFGRWNIHDVKIQNNHIYKLAR